MNLHLLPDSKFSEAFYLNVKECGLLDKNKFVVRTNQKALKYIKQAIPFAPLYSSQFSNHVGETFDYDKVFIHQLSPLMYRWIAKNRFRALDWMTWGTDLYNLPFIKANFYEPETAAFIKRMKFDFSNFLYLTKVYITNMPYKNAAYSKIKSMLTWMSSEYKFAITHLPALKASHQYFFYENAVPYEKINALVATSPEQQPNAHLKLVLGNSGTPANNHLDAIRFLQSIDVAADLFIPVSYGEPKYIAYLKQKTGFYTKGNIVFLDEFMDFERYVHFLNSCDGILMNHIRPQGYGNIFMMMYLNKPVLFNKKNISLLDIKALGLKSLTIEDVASLRRPTIFQDNRAQIVKLLSHEQLITLYTDMFS